MPILAKQLQLVQQTFTSFGSTEWAFFCASVGIFYRIIQQQKKSLMKQQKRQPVSYILSKRAHIEKREVKKKHTK